MCTSVPFSDHVYCGVPPLVDDGTNVTFVPGHMEPDGVALMETAGVAGAATDNAPKSVPLAPVAIPATPVATDARIDPAAADVVSACTCRPVIVTWSAPVVAATVTFTVSALLLIAPDMPVMFDPVT